MIFNTTEHNQSEQRKIRNELILLGVYDFAGLVCLVGAMVGTVYIIAGWL